MAYRYEITVRHDGLHKVRVVRAPDRWQAEAIAEQQRRAWDEQWERKLEREQKRAAAESAKSEKEQMRAAADRARESKKAEAERITAEAQELRTAMEGILARTLEVDDAVDWNGLLDKTPFPEPEPQKPVPPPKPAKPELRLPSRIESKPGLFRRFLESMTLADPEARLQREEEHYQLLVRTAKNEYTQAVRTYNEAAKRYNEDVRRAHAVWQSDLDAWNGRKQTFLVAQREHNQQILDWQQRYQDKDPGAVSQYCELVLQNSEYPDFFPGNFELQLKPESWILVVDYELPIPEDIPSTKSARYVATKDEIQLTTYKPAEIGKLYDSLVYQTALRTIHELFEADKAQALQAVVFNGYTNSVDKSTGKDVTGCILSVEASKDDFLQIDLGKVEPAKCIRKLRGVSATTLYDLTPVAPVLNIDKEDARFVESREVITNIGGGDNLAAMDWEQFEHLVRELFEKEFAAGGAEVKITRASRDWGVDAIMFDPDPLRGGKYVLQAKRYTQLVPVSAVRDLYGTVINEGAVKGILVTTAYYGPESYEFAKDKPLTLLDGSNLLSMLQKHGVKAHIDIKAARKILGLSGADKEGMG